jgi:hypothetical protein
MFWKQDLFPFSGERRKTPTLLGSLPLDYTVLQYLSLEVYEHFIECLLYLTR